MVEWKRLEATPQISQFNLSKPTLAGLTRRSEGKEMTTAFGIFICMILGGITGVAVTWILHKKHIANINREIANMEDAITNIENSVSMLDKTADNLRLMLTNSEKQSLTKPQRINDN